MKEPGNEVESIRGMKRRMYGQQPGVRCSKCFESTATVILEAFLGAHQVSVDNSAAQKPL